MTLNDIEQVATEHPAVCCMPYAVYRRQSGGLLG